MTTDPMSIEYSQNMPATAAGSLRAAERFASFADYADSTTSLPQPAATSLDVARFFAFTGELTFSVDPAVRLYLDRGSVYHAERDGGPPLSRILLDAGVIDPVQLRRGIVSVGDVEHLGRLFDREPSIDRDVVMVVVERSTEALVQQIANSAIATVTGLAYRHHPSGIHRWFVAPVERFALHRPSSGVLQVDRSVVEELPQLIPPSALPEQPVDDRGSDHDHGSDRDRESDRDRGSVDDALYIEWAEPDLSNPGHRVATDDLEPPTVDTETDTGFEPGSEGRTDDIDDSGVGATETEIDIEAELDRFDADRADWSTPPNGDDPVAPEPAPAPLGEFRLVWPDGTRDESIIAADGLPVEQPGPIGDASSTDHTSTDHTSFTNEETSDGTPAAFDPPIDTPPLPVDTAPVPESAEPSPTPSAIDSDPLSARNDHRDANDRRESRGLPAPNVTDGAGTRIEPVQLDWIPGPDAAVPDDVATVVRRALRAIESAGSRPVHPDTVVSWGATSAEPAAPSGVEPVGFAPPSLHTRADAVSERTGTEDDFWALTAAAEADGRDGDDKNERRSALRRLIGSLRSKD